jgi:hypothetical protein
MDTNQILVTIVGVLLVGFILWFFFGPRRSRSIPPGTRVRTGQSPPAPPTAS